MMDIKLAAQAMRPLLARCTKEVEGGDATALHHLIDMIDKIEAGEVSGEKAHRWLGWIQGVVCCRGGATLDEMKAVNFAA
jgi:hypothetical protein